MNIYLLRHGETDWNKEGLLQGHTDISLNEKGRAQVRGTVEKLGVLGIRMDQIIASPLSRARESAEIAAGILGYPRERIAVEPMLIERAFGLGEGLTAEERERRYPDSRYPQMEPQEELIKRAGRAFHKIIDSCQGAENILLVAHGAVLYALLAACTEGHLVYGGKAGALRQGSVFMLRDADGQMRVEEYDDEAAAFVAADLMAENRSLWLYMREEE